MTTEQRLKASGYNLEKGWVPKLTKEEKLAQIEREKTMLLKTFMALEEKEEDIKNDKSDNNGLSC